MLSAIATDIRDFSLSGDGQEATFVLVTKHSGEIAITIPADRLHTLRLPFSTTPAPAPAPAQRAPTDGGKPEMTAGDRPSGNVTVTVPKKWYVAGDAQKKLVIVVLDPMAPSQSGFALQPKAATEFAQALAKKAEAVIAGHA
jgi:hypothetical protein